MPHGHFRHDSIVAAPAVRHERLIGWTAHYLIGILFAGVLLMQPGMGAGIAASRTPHPAAARVQSVITHTVFGVGLYGAAWLARLL
jgi:hypothetical protein